MSEGAYNVAIRLATAATQFSAASAAVTFLEYTNVNARGASVAARILGYSYNAGGGAEHDVTITLRRAGGTNADEFIILEERLAANSEQVNSITVTCGGDGITVPKQYGTFGTTQPPATRVLTGETYQVFIETANKNSAATFQLWYSVQ